MAHEDRWAIASESNRHSVLGGVVAIDFVIEVWTHPRFPQCEGHECEACDDDPDGDLFDVVGCSDVDTTNEVGDPKHEDVAVDG